MTTPLDFAEAAAKVNADFHIAMADGLAKESNTFLNLLIGGAGALTAYEVSLIGKPTPVPDWQLIAVGAGATYLFCVAALLLWKCLWVRDLYPPANEPGNIPIEGYPLENVRIGELAVRQQCIELNKRRNRIAGNWLNRCRAMAAATPAVAIAVAGLVQAAAC